MTEITILRDLMKVFAHTQAWVVFCPVCLCRLHVAEIAAKNRSREPREFQKVTQQADSRKLKYLSLGSSVDMAEARIERKAYAQAEQELQTDLDKSEKMGSRFQTARIQYPLGNVLRLSAKDSGASGHYSLALTLMQDMSKDQETARSVGSEAHVRRTLSLCGRQELTAAISPGSAEPLFLRL